ncbi:ABC transporter permease [Paenibacillus sacheonensis]|uniref:ABC transporter permease subunit n=1 Tax=Paenibacillus sacheonensis TaxID=742054 RepID=A0A7X5BUJ8_9BACL|nr:ABC transporter permease subunit [Paenibacillus sacheonensis]MBM7564249.1 putative aldouronate transport system permease protein [Paenibacillus sacheonensis]NBC67428.1 ABC transporter permease subunit [Paenibacillus sacheonensis]
MNKLLNRGSVPLHLMLIPAVALVFIFNYIPLFGIVIAFEKYIPARGVFHSKWVGFQNFTYLIHLPGTFQTLVNTLYISLMKIIAFIVVPVIFALLLNEVRNKLFKRSVQTIVYLPHFMSWIILSGILIDILSPSDGIVNMLLKSFGLKPIFFLGDVHWFPYVIVSSDLWKEFGFNTILYLAALTAINPTLYEAAKMDGAGRWRQTFHVTLPGIVPVIVLLATLSMGNVLNAGFDQVFNLYSPAVYQSGDILDTFIYRLGMLDAQYGVATAVGLFKSVVSFIFIAGSYALARKFADYRVF